MNRRVEAILQCSSEYIPNVTGICMNGTTEYCYIVSSNEYYNNKIIVSYNGIDWDTITISSLDNSIIYHWNAICWSPKLDNNYLCAVGNDGYAITSTNGINWTLRNISETNTSYQMVYWSNSDNKYYAINDTSKMISTSEDGINWSERQLTDEEYSDLQKLHFVSTWNINDISTIPLTDKISYNGTGNTTDNTKWFESIDGPFAVVNNEAGAPVTDYIILNYDSNNRVFNVIYPTDNKGINVVLNKASDLTSFEIAYALSDITVIAATYSELTGNVYAIDNSNKCWYSSTMYDWQSVSSVGLSDIVTDMAYVEDLETFYVISGIGDNAVSTNGITWVKGYGIPRGESNLDPRWNKLCWSPKYMRMLAVSSAEYPYVAYTYDGREYTLSPFNSSFTNYAINDIIWSEKFEKYIAVTKDNSIIWSDDGLDWSVASTINNCYGRITTLTEATITGEIIVTTGNRLCIFRSNDCVNWRVIELPETDEWYRTSYISAKGFFAVFGYETVMYTADFKNWEITKHEYTFGNPLKVIEIGKLNKCIVTDITTYTTYNMTLGASAETGATLSNRPKWIKARFLLNDDINLVKNCDFTTDLSNWNIVKTKPTDVLSRSLAYSNELEAGIMTVSVNTSLVEGNTSNDVGISTDWLKVDPNTEYVCRLLAQASSPNCYAYLYGKNSEDNQVLIKSSSSISMSEMSEIYMDFVSRDYTHVKLSILYTQATFGASFNFTNVRIHKRETALADNSMFDVDAKASNYDIECNSIVNTQAIKLLGANDSYIEIEQPFETNDSITLCFWTKFNDLNFVGHKSILYSGTADSNLKLYVSDSNMNLFVELLGTAYDTGFHPEIGTWYHIAVTYDLTRLSLYINGALEYTTEKMVGDFDDVSYESGSYQVRFGCLAEANTNDYIISQWDGKTVTTEWYTNNATNTFNINSASDLAGFARIVNTGISDFAECIVNLKTNIYLNNNDWTPIGIYTKNIQRPFKGIFNGNNYDITGLRVTINENTYNDNSIDSGALFGYVSGVGNTQTCNITSVKVNGACDSSLYPDDVNLSNEFCNLAGIVAYGIDFKISDCEFTGSIDGVNRCAGIVARANTVEIYNCTNNAGVYVNDGDGAGIVAAATDARIVNCKNTANIEIVSKYTDKNSAGIAAHYENVSLPTGTTYYEISNCENSGNISSTQLGNTTLTLTTAGIVAIIENNTSELRIQGNLNVGNIKGVTDSGGIVGIISRNESTKLSIYECINTGEVTDIVEFVGLVSDITPESIRNIGGIVARIGINNTQYLNVYACINTGTIYKAENSGGIIGIIVNRTNVYNCYNNGKVYNSYNSSGIIGNVNGLCTINNCLNTGSINTLQSQAPRYIGAIIGKAASVGNIQGSANSVYLNTSLSYEGNVYDSIIETFSKSHKELVDPDILYILNGGKNENEKYRYAIEYRNEIVSYLNMAGKFPIPEELLVLLNSIIDEKINAISEYVPMACSLVDIQFYDFALSHKLIRDMATARILNYKCAEKAETNVNFIPVANGTFANLYAKTEGESYYLPTVEKIEDPVGNIYGNDVYKVTYIKNSKGSNIGAIREHVTTDEFVIDTTVSDYTFSIYIKDADVDNNYSKLHFMFIVNGDTENFYSIKPSITGETMGSNQFTGKYMRYSVGLGQMFANGDKIRLAIGLTAGPQLGETDPNILEKDFTVYFAAPQLENKSVMTDYIEGKVDGILRDTSCYLRHIHLPIATCPLYDDNELAYKFNAFKYIDIPSIYTKPKNVFTVAFWYKIPARIGNNDNSLIPKCIVSRTNSFFGNGSGWLIGVNSSYDNDIVFQCKTKTQVKDTRFYIVTQNVTSWAYLTAVYDNGNTYTYVNGKLASYNTDPFKMEHCVIGAEVTGITIGSNFTDIEGVNSMNGDMIRDFKMFNSALSETEILDLYQGSGIVDTLGLLHAFRFNTADENDVVNFNIEKKQLTANSWHIINLEDCMVNFWPMWGTTKNYTTDNSGNILYVNDINITKGVKNLRSFRFDGVSSYANTKSEVDFSSIPNSTITFWIKIAEEDTKNACIIELSESAIENNAFSIYLTKDGYIQYSDCGVTESGSTVPSVTSATKVNDGSWHYVAIDIIRCSSVVIYIDNNKDAQMDNYASITSSTEISSPESIWHNEYSFNTLINSIYTRNNKLYINRMSEKNTLTVYNNRGNDTDAITAKDLFNSQSTYIAQIEYYNGHVYVLGHDYQYGMSCVLDINQTTGDRKIISIGYYSPIMTINNDFIYISDRNTEVTKVVKYTKYVCNYATNNGISLDYKSYYVNSIDKVYDNDKTYTTNDYAVNGMEIVWKDNGEHPESEYYVDFTYTRIEYTTYYVKGYDIATKNTYTYPVNHDAMITAIEADSSGRVYTASKDCSVRCASIDKLLWICDCECWINDIKLLPNQQTLLAACRDKTLRRITVSGIEISKLYNENERETIRILSYNGNMYCAYANNTYRTNIENIEKDASSLVYTSSTNTIAKIDNFGNIIWEYVLYAPAVDIGFDENTNHIYVVGSDGTIYRIDEISVIPYNNYRMYIGSQAGTKEFFKGLIQDIKIYNKNLSMTEKEIQYNLYDQRINRPVQIDAENDVYVYQDIYEVL